MTVFNTISQNKLNDMALLVKTNKNAVAQITAYNRYFDANIPVEYWNLSFNKNFTGSSNIKDLVETYVKDIKLIFREGKSFCFAGPHGVGKTFALVTLLKDACHKDFKCLYTTLSDMVSIITTGSNQEKFLARQELLLADFLVIDEFDSRFFSSESASELFGKTLENIFRTRSQNKMPTFMATNSPNILEAFSGPIKQSLESLMKGYMETIPVFGTDFRKG